jgi:Flp pilus assembly protein TadD
MVSFAGGVRRGVVGVCVLLSSCAAAGPNVAAGQDAQDAYGPFLAARYADAVGDPDAATAYYMRALRYDPRNTQLMGEGFLAALLAGSPQAATLAAGVPGNALSTMLEGNDDVGRGHYGEAAQAFGALPPDDLAGLIKPLLLAWVRYGAGDPKGAIGLLAPHFNADAFGQVYALNAALIADAAHDGADAGRLYAAVASAAPNLRLAEIEASWLDRSGQTVAAQSQLVALVAAHPDMQIALAGLQAHSGRRVIVTPAQGVAEAYLTLAGSIQAPQQAFLRVIFLRFALSLRPDLTAARLLLASIVGGADNPHGSPTTTQLQNALDVLAPVPPGDALYGPVALQRAGLLASMGQPAQAVALLRPLIAQAPHDVGLRQLAGDIERAANQNQAAIADYDAALGLIGRPLPPAAWSLLFDRGICEDAQGDWQAAEADMVAARALAPNQPYVLNYLAYSWALRGQHLAQAHDMLTRALGLDPNDGAVIDSLGFVELKQGQTQAAMLSLVKAVELDPDDAEVNAHLGDAFAQAGQALQAQYQWRRALSLKPDDRLKSELTAKLAHDAPA